MGLFSLLVSSRFKFGGLAESRYLPISFRLFSLTRYRLLNFLILCFFVVCYNVPLLIPGSVNLDHIFLWLSWTNDLLIFFIISKNQLVDSLILWIDFLVSISLIYALIFTISCHLLGSFGLLWYCAHSNF